MTTQTEQTDEQKFKELVKKAIELIKEFKQDKKECWFKNNPLQNPLMYILEHHFEGDLK